MVSKTQWKNGVFPLPLMGFGSIPNKLQRCATHYNSLVLTPSLRQENIVKQSVRCPQQLRTASPFALRAMPAAMARRSALFVTKDGLRGKEKNPVKGRCQLQQLSQTQLFFTVLHRDIPKSQPKSCSTTLDAQLSSKAGNPEFPGKMLLLWCCSLGRGHQGA